MREFSVADFGALTSKVVHKLSGWGEDLVVMLPNLLLALLLVILGAVVSRWGQRTMSAALRRLTHNEPISRLVGSVARIAIWAMAGLWALELVHLDKAVTSVLAGVGVLGLALGFAFQDIAANFMSGFIMALYRPFNVGDLVDVAGHQCRVQRIDLRATEVETLDGLSIIVPNKEIFQNPIVNYTRTNTRRMDLSVGTAHGDDMERVRKVVLTAVQSVPQRDSSREVELFFSGFGDSSINFEVRIWLADSSQVAFLNARSEAMIAIKKAFDREGITIPFPIRTLDFGAGAVGGKPLDLMQLRFAQTPNERRS